MIANETLIAIIERHCIETPRHKLDEEFRHFKYFHEENLFLYELFMPDYGTICAIYQKYIDLKYCEEEIRRAKRDLAEKSKQAKDKGTLLRDLRNQLDEIKKIQIQAPPVEVS